MREYFNRLSGVLVLGVGLIGLVAGWVWGGPPGAVFGLAGGVAAGGALVERGRFYLP